MKTHNAAEAGDFLPRRPDIFIRVPLAAFELFRDRIATTPFHFELYINAAGLERYPVEALSEIAAFARAHGSRIRVHGPFMDLLPGAEDRRIIDVVIQRFLQAVDACIALGSPSMVLHAAFDPLNYGYRKKEWLAHSRDTWTEFAARCPANSPRILIENVFDVDTDLLGQLFETLPESRFSACFDVGHWHVYARQSLQAWFDDLGSRIEEIHMHDNDGSGDQHAAIGNGTIDFAQLAGILTSRQFHPTLTIENLSIEDACQSYQAISRRFP